MTGGVTGGVTGGTGLVTVTTSGSEVPAATAVTVGVKRAVIDCWPAVGKFVVNAVVPPATGIVVSCVAPLKKSIVPFKSSGPLAVAVNVTLSPGTGLILLAVSATLGTTLKVKAWVS